jgi:DNA-binding beta-propeller fold protein YncE
MVIKTKYLFSLLLFFSVNVAAVDISNPLNLLFVSDKDDNIIDVVDLQKEESVYRIHTNYLAHDIIATPYAPLLFYTSLKDKKLIVYDLDTREHVEVIDLPIEPQHIVLDTTGTRIGISNSDTGGFVLVSAYAMDIMFTLDKFPPTTDVLFDPNDIDIYYTNNLNGTIGIIDMNTQQTYEMSLDESSNTDFSSPSRSLDGRYIYVANNQSGEIYSLNAYEKKIYNKFSIGESPVRPYTSPEGWFLYMIDKESGRFISLDQGEFTEYSNTVIGEGIDLVSVGRFDRLNLFLSSTNKKYYIYDNLSKELIKTGELKDTPINVFGSLDGTMAYVAFSETPEIAAINLESQSIKYISATNNGAGTYSIGMSNQVCH